MSSKGKRIIKSAKQALAYLDGDKSQARIRYIPKEPIDVKAIRKKTNLSQAKFAMAYRLTLATVRNWEQGRREPDGPAVALLAAIKHNPEAVREAIEKEF